MRRLVIMVVLALGSVFATVSRATTYTDDFEGGTNTAGWHFIQGADILESSGGNPGWWLHQPLYDTFDPALQSAWGSSTPFTGDYRARGVTRISFDGVNLDMDFPPGEGLNVALLLRNTHGTPDDFDDDDFAYFVGPNIPLVGQGWVQYAIDIPSQSLDPVPAGWSGGWPGDCSSFRSGVTWSDVITHVDRVEIHWLEPCLFAIFQQWNVGADNVSIEYGEPTPVSPSSWGSVKRLYRR